MGIKGLLPLLSSIQRPCNLSKFSGQTLGVDVYGWLHRATTSCAVELGTGQPTTAFVDYAMHRVRMLQHFGVTPYIVFDGDRLPSKAATERDRRLRREKSKRAAQEFMSLGKVSKAHAEFKKAVDVTPEMARQLIDELNRCGVQYVVAPYEADAQLAYLERIGLVQGVISEDSDLLVFGCQCLLTKLDKYGECIEINRRDFTACREINLAGWSNDEFRTMAILGGCDYLDNITNFGLMKAYRAVRKHKKVEVIIQHLQFDGQVAVPPNYLDSFRRADLTFRHQWVFCPKKQHLVNFTELDAGLDFDELPFLGSNVSPELAVGVSRGQLHPTTKQELNPRSGPPTKVKFSPLRTGPPKANSGQTINNMKGHKSIDTFFKANRVPLAELDPNSFVMTPHQQSVSRINANASWASSPVPVPFSQRPSSTTRQPMSAPPLVRALAPKRDLGNRPIKRPRLCEDVGDDTGSGKQGQSAGIKSRFFGSTSAQENITTPRQKRVDTKKKRDPTTFSDDSIEDDLLNLVPSAHKNLKPNKKLPTPIARKAPRDEALRIISSRKVDEPFVGGNSIGEKFSYKPKPTKQSAKISVHADVKLQTSAASLRATATLEITKSKPVVKVTSTETKQPLTPLQRIGVAAMARVRPGDDLVSKVIDPSLLSPDGLLVPLDFGDEPSTSQQRSFDIPTGGSEDLIVPASDSDECSEPSASPRCYDVKGTFDLSQFAFTKR